MPRSLQLRLKRLEGAEARRVVEVLNEMPPETDYAADSLVLASFPSVRLVRFLLLERGCLTDFVDMPQETARRILGVGV